MRRIAERSAPILKAAAETLGIRSLDVIQALAAIAFADPRRIARWGPNGITLTPSDELTDQDARAVAEVSVHRSKRGTRVRYRTHDKVRALIELADRFGIDKAEMERLFPNKMTPEQRRARILELIKKGRRLALAEAAAKKARPHP